MNEIKIAQIGVGYWGPNLLRNLMANNNCIIIKVVDIFQDRLDFVNSLYPAIKISTNPDDVLNDPNIDAIVIATPAESHYELTMNALEANKHVLVEKPMATTVEHVKEIGRLADEKNLVAMVGHTFLYNAAVNYVKAMIDSDELGDIRYIYSQRLNLGRIRSDTDALWNFGPHDISIIQYWLNDQPALSVTKSGMDYLQNEVDDVVFLNIVYPNKVMAHIHVSWLDPHKIRRMTVVGSERMVVYDDIAENKIAIYDKGIDRKAILGDHMDYDNSKGVDFDLRSGDVLLPKIEWEEPLKVEIEHFLDCILNGTDCITGTDHAAKVVDVLSRA
tara:strand:+ start:297 stop:1289 length:993 start_codon:yes stop_codon:yes gene_type:complete